VITLEQAKVGMAKKVDQMVIDEFRRGSLLLDRLPFDNAASPGTGGSTLTYGYIKLKTPSTATFRELNNEYVPNQAIREEHVAYLKIFGGEFNLDRVIINTSGAVDELDFQLREKVVGATNLFHYSVINGDRAVNPNEFDGLDVFLTGSSTEFNVGNPIDISNSAMLDTQYHAFLDMMDEFVSGMDGQPSMFLANTKLATRIKGIARRAGYYTRLEDAFGRSVDAWNDIPIVDLGNFYRPDPTDPTLPGTTLPVVPIDGGVTSLYAVIFANDGFHGVSPTGNSIIQTHLPNLSDPGVIKKGDVEMVAGVVLKNSLKAGVFRDIQVQ